MRQSTMIDTIEWALRETPYCPQCGEHTDIVDVDGNLVLRCTAIDQPRSRLERIVATIVGPSHVSVPVIERANALAA